MHYNTFSHSHGSPWYNNSLFKLLGWLLRLLLLLLSGPQLPSTYCLPIFSSRGELLPLREPSSLLLQPRKNPLLIRTSFALSLLPLGRRRCTLVSSCCRPANFSLYCCLTENTRRPWTVILDWSSWSICRRLRCKNPKSSRLWFGQSHPKVIYSVINDNILH